MLVDKQNELMSDLLFTVHQHGGDDVTWKPPIGGFHAVSGDTNNNGEINKCWWTNKAS